MPILTDNFIFVPPTPTTEQELGRATGSLKEFVRSSFNQMVNIQRAGNNTIWYNPNLTAQQVFDALSANGEAAELATYYESLSVFIRSTSEFQGVSAELIAPASGYIITMPAGTVTVVP